MIRPALIRVLGAVLCIATALPGVAGSQAAAGHQAQAAKPASTSAGSHRDDPYTRAGFERFYSMDYDGAIHNFELAYKNRPGDPFAVNHVLTGVLFRELYRMGVLDPDAYANNSFVSQPHHPADPKAQARINALIRESVGLSEKRIEENPNDVDAIFARGVTRGMRSTYLALVERSWFAALRSAIGARRDHERVLQLDPNYTDAKLVVGIHNYVVGSLPLAVKVAASMAGLGGSKSKGIEYMYEAANHGRETTVDAKVALMVFLRREHRFGEALVLARSLSQSYPHNFLFAVEEPDIMAASGQNQAAVPVYRRLFDDGKKGRFPNGHYELAAYKLGELLRSEKDYRGAADSYNLAGQVQNPDAEILQKANLAAGEMYDVLKQRDLAVKKYEAVVTENSSSPPAEVARKHIKEAYRAD